jgi:hypothetical protein
MMGVFLAALAIGVPAAAFTLWHVVIVATTVGRTNLGQEPAFAALGLTYEGDVPDDPDVVEVAKATPELMDFEARIGDDPEVYVRLRALEPEHKSYLVIRRSDRPGSESDAVVESVFSIGGSSFTSVGVRGRYPSSR